MSAGKTDTGLRRTTNGFLCFLKVSPSIIAVMSEMLMCSRHLLRPGKIPRAASPGVGALLLCTWPTAGEREQKQLWGMTRAVAVSPAQGHVGLGIAGCPFTATESSGTDLQICPVSAGGRICSTALCSGFSTSQVEPV